MRKLVFFAVLVLLLGNYLTSNLFAQRMQQQPRGMSPELAFEQFEQKLINLRNYQMTFSVATELAVNSKFEGTLRVSDGNIDLTADGSYNGRRVNVRFNSTASILSGGTQTDSFELPAPENFYTYFIEGMTRLGLGYTLFLLTEGKPPVYPETVDEESEFADITYISTGERRFVGNVEAFPFGLSYSSFGQSLGDGRLWINVTSGLPFRREGSLRLEQGAMNVVEFYGFSR